MGLAGGLALFLFGLEEMAAALKAVAGNRLRTVLARLTVNRLAGVATGAFITAMIQSSSVTTVLIVSFISSGLMSLSQSIGVILGANIGSTVTAQIVAFKVTKLAFAMIAAGFAATWLAHRESLRHHGKGILGLGLVFLGMTVMGESMSPLRHDPHFLEWMVRMQNPLLGIAAGALFTGVVQSSGATTGVVIAMASQGLISLPAGIALILGANIGTCVTALLAAIGKPREALRAALAHVLFNVGGVLLWVGFVDDLAWLATVLSPQIPALDGTARLAAETPRQIANAHTIFNVLNAALCLPFSTLLARAVERLVPDRPLAEEELIRASYLDEALLATPALALQQVHRELERLMQLVEEMLQAVLPAMLEGNREALASIAERDDAVDTLYEHIISYLGRISEQRLGDRETAELMHLVSLTNAIENTGDVIETDLVSKGKELVSAGVRISPATAKVIEEFHGEVARALGDARSALAEGDGAAARRVVAMKPRIHELADRATRHQVTRLIAPEAGRLPAYAVETDVIEDLRRVYYFAKRIARAVLAYQDGEES
ncbi:MAG: Na/Pi cotransporter family protein [Myxococcales bacterium]|nr:MAG: Na/Pi cotransporter family protein [Myxococcales bacterium]